MKYFILQTPGEIRLLSASNAFDGKLSLQMKGFRITSGILETWAKDEKMSVGFLERLLKQGYISITEFEYARYLKTSATLLSNEGKEPEGETCHIVPWAAVEMQFYPGFFNDPNEYLESPELRNFCVYAGDTFIDGDLIIDYSELATTAQTKTRNIIVNGNLTIKGNFDAGQDIEALPQFVYITGDLNAENLILSGWLDIIVAGNATIGNMVFGYFGEPGGRLQVKGNLTTRYLLNGFMYRIEVEGITNGICYSFDPIDSVAGFEAQKIKDSFSEEEELVASPLASSVIPYDQDIKEYGFNFELTCAMLRKGQTIFKSI
ncbi:hypothetical protein [Pedobacter sp. FW305-3-2-15-E-R2A2]|uniref:hypothetical protein n=1 Tax=Pedobacter sp. FW305-3-2-15-E-R2A2 TaxID=3140251 RepID=UPI0031406CAE